MMDESDGTQKLIAVLPVLLMALREGRLVIIDELDAKLHPKLLRYVIAMFKNPRINQNRKKYGMMPKKSNVDKSLSKSLHLPA